MRVSAKARETMIGDLLKKELPEADPVARGLWRLTLSSNGKVISGDARIEDDWLVLDAPLNPSGRPKAWDLLRRNARLHGSSKFAVPPGGKEPHLVAELPLDDEIELPVVLKSTLRGFIQGLTRKAPPGREARADGKAGDLEDLAERCRASGWPAEERNGGPLVVRLPARRGSYSAEVDIPRNGGVRVSVALSPCESFSGKTRRALGLLLLTACGSVRHARAAVDETGDEPVVCFEARLSDSPAPAELEHALSAVSVACDFCGPEVRALEDEAVASRYLEIRGQFFSH